MYCILHKNAILTVSTPSRILLVHKYYKHTYGCITINPYSPNHCHQYYNTNNNLHYSLATISTPKVGDFRVYLLGAQSEHYSPA